MTDASQNDCVRAARGMGRGVVHVMGKRTPTDVAVQRDEMVCDVGWPAFEVPDHVGVVFHQDSENVENDRWRCPACGEDTDDD